jgi:hypothetical protein
LAQREHTNLKFQVNCKQTHKDNSHEQDKYGR